MTRLVEPYTVIHLLVVDVACVLFWTQSVCMVPNQNTRNIYHKQMNNGVATAGTNFTKPVTKNNSGPIMLQTSSEC